LSFLIPDFVFYYTENESLAAGLLGLAEDPSIPPSTIPISQNKDWYCIFAAGPLIFNIEIYKHSTEIYRKNVLNVLK
jgi:hypothetical protein